MILIFCPETTVCEVVQMVQKRETISQSILLVAQGDMEILPPYLPVCEWATADVPQLVCVRKY